MHNYNKARLITDSKDEYINHIDILNSQLKLKKEKNEIYVLSTFPFLVIDYNFDKTMEVLKMKLKDNFIEIDDRII